MYIIILCVCVCVHTQLSFCTVLLWKQKQMRFLISDSLLLQVYKKKTEAAKKEYLKQLAAYRASLVSKVTCNHVVLGWIVAIWLQTLMVMWKHKRLL